MTFLPQGYELPKSSGSYTKLTQGDNKFRILGQAITGYEYFNTEKKPVRSPEFPKSTPNIGKNEKGIINPVKHFWAFPIWNYATNKIEILELTQSTIQSAIAGYSADEDWGDVTEFDITVNKKGELLTTEYQIRPSPKKPLSDDIKEAMKNAPRPNLEALFTNANPFETDLRFETDGVDPLADEEVKIPEDY